MGSPGCLLLEFPILSRARFAELVEGTRFDEQIHFFVERLDALKEIGEGSKLFPLTFFQNYFFRALGEAFYSQKGHADLLYVGRPVRR